jgi:GNAT superfamily N-acetyltransferase
MSGSNLFDHTPDEELGSLLRAHLSAPEDDGFTVRVLARLGAREDSSLEVLARWARLGIAAALLLAAAATLAARAGTPRVATDDGLLPPSETSLAAITSGL